MSALRHHSESGASGVRFLGPHCCALLGRDCRALCLRSASILKSSADTCVDVDTLAGFFPGVCAALVHLLLRGDFKLVSHVVVAVCGALRAWIARVKDQSRRLQDRRPERCYTATQACTSFSTFCAVFRRATHGPAASMWREKVSGRRGFLEQCIVVLYFCASVQIGWCWEGGCGADGISFFTLLMDLGLCFPTQLHCSTFRE